MKFSHFIKEGKFYVTGENHDEIVKELADKIHKRYAKASGHTDHQVYVEKLGHNKSDITLHHFSHNDYKDHEMMDKDAKKHKKVTDVKHNQYYEPAIDMASRTIIPASNSITVTTR